MKTSTEKYSRSPISKPRAWSRFVRARWLGRRECDAGSPALGHDQAPPDSSTHSRVCRVANDGGQHRRRANSQVWTAPSSSTSGKCNPLCRSPRAFRHQLAVDRYSTFQFHRAATDGLTCGMDRCAGREWSVGAQSLATPRDITKSEGRRHHSAPFAGEAVTRHEARSSVHPDRAMQLSAQVAQTLKCAHMQFLDVGIRPATSHGTRVVADRQRLGPLGRVSQASRQATGLARPLRAANRAGRACGRLRWLGWPGELNRVLFLMQLLFECVA